MSDYYEEPIIGDEPIRSENWLTLRHAEIREVVHGSNIRFRVQIWDEGREPFITQWFNDPRPAQDFLDRVKDENERYHNFRLGGNEDVA